MEVTSLANYQLAKTPGAIIFDWDNTLVDTLPVIQDALNTALTAFGYSPWTMPETRMRVKKSLRDSFPDLFGDNWESAGKVFYNRYQEIHLDKLKVIHGASELLRNISSKNIPLSVVSNKRGDILRAEIIQLGWRKYFSSIVGANDAPRDKPAREPVDLALSYSDIDAGPNVWFVGDADIDVECAKNARCTSVVIGKDTAGDGSPIIEADFKFPHCMALSKFIDNL